MLKKYTIGITLPMTFCVEVLAENKSAAVHIARKQALDTPLKDWNDDFSKATQDILNIEESDEEIHHNDILLTKDGVPVRLAFVPDAEPNRGGWYVEIYAWNPQYGFDGDRTDDFVIHPDDCDCSSEQAVREYARNHIRNLNLYPQC